jgi:hypothetical protein
LSFGTFGDEVVEVSWCFKVNHPLINSVTGGLNHCLVGKQLTKLPKDFVYVFEIVCWFSFYLLMLQKSYTVIGWC